MSACATERCERPAAWQSVLEVSILGSNAPRRCTVCCDVIGEIVQSMIQAQKCVVPECARTRQTELAILPVFCGRIPKHAPHDLCDGCPPGDWLHPELEVAER